MMQFYPLTNLRPSLLDLDLVLRSSYPALQIFEPSPLWSLDILLRNEYSVVFYSELFGHGKTHGFPLPNIDPQASKLSAHNSSTNLTSGTPKT